MAVKIRLKQVGKKDQRSYRIVATDENNKRDGKVIETLGHSNPHITTNSFKLNKVRFDYWISVGAQVSDGVAKLLTNKKS